MQWLNVKGVGTHKHEEEELGGFLLLELTALTFTLRIWQSARNREEPTVTNQNLTNANSTLNKQTECVAEMSGAKAVQKAVQSGSVLWFIFQWTLQQLNFS